MDWRSLPIIAFDTETTGLNPTGGDRVIEFAAVVIQVGQDGKPIQVQPHQMLFNPGIPIPPKVVQLTGIDDSQVADAPPFEERAMEVRRLLQGGICVAHNMAFDRIFISEELRRAGLTWPDPLAEIDTVDLSMRQFKDAQSHKLGDLAKRLGINLENAHRATHDAEACGRAFTEMARMAGAPSDLHGMLDWADALGEPPKNDYLGRSPYASWLFTDGPHKGEPVEHHPVHLQWMTMARERRDGRWDYRFPESLRRWCDRFLKCRAAGRARQGIKGGAPDEWGIDSNAWGLR